MCFFRLRFILHSFFCSNVGSSKHHQRSPIALRAFFGLLVLVSAFRACLLAEVCQLPLDLALPAATLVPNEPAGVNAGRLSVLTRPLFFYKIQNWRKPGR